MHTVSPQVKRWLFIGTVYVLAMSLLGPVAEAAFRLDRADGSRPGNGIHITGMVTAAREPLGAPLGSFLPKRTYKAASASVAVPLPTRNTDSSNAFVDPWGCEAETAQDWSASGKYWGKYQFDRQTWAAHGGTNYGSASEAEQDAVAARVKYDAWPNC